jgi:hypothetical protein
MWFTYGMTDNDLTTAFVEMTLGAADAELRCDTCSERVMPATVPELTVLTDHVGYYKHVDDYGHAWWFCGEPYGPNAKATVDGSEVAP